MKLRSNFVSSNNEYFTIIKTNLFRINDSLNNKYLVDSYYLILFISFCRKQ